MAAKEGKILIIRGGAIGDFILTLPALRAVRETFHDVELDLLGYPNVAELARASELIDSFKSIEARALAGFFARRGELDPQLSAYFKQVNVVISYLYDPDEFFKLNIGRVSAAQFVQGPHRPDEGANLHATEVFLRPLEKLAIYGADPEPGLKIETENPFGRKEFVAMHPGSGSEKKNWPVERWEAFGKALLETTELAVLVVGGEADQERVEWLKGRLKEGPRVKYFYNQPLLVTARMLGAARCMVGHDSGITHLAAALGVPCLALWGPSNSNVWRPRSPKARLLSCDGGLEELSEQTVLRQFEFLLRSCY